MAGTGSLTYKSTNGKIAYKKQGSDIGKLVFKVEKPGWTTIQFTWGTNGSDLDIMAYWVECGSGTAIGWNHGTQSTTEVTKQYNVGGNTYYVIWSGDKRGPTGEEYVKINKQYWSVGSNEFIIKLNFYGYDASDFPASTCTVIASQEKGNTLFLDNVTCGTRALEEATGSDPGVKLNFDKTGKLISLIQI